MLKKAAEKRLTTLTVYRAIFRLFERLKFGQMIRAERAAYGALPAHRPTLAADRIAQLGSEVRAFDQSVRRRN